MTEDRGLWCVGMWWWQWQYVGTIFAIPAMCWPGGEADTTQHWLLIGREFAQLGSDWLAADPEVTPGHGTLGHVTWCWQDIFISSHIPHTLATWQISGVQHWSSVSLSVHYTPTLTSPLTPPLTYTTFYARSYHPQHQNVQSSIKSQRWSVVKVISLETINTKTPSHIQLAITFWTRDIFPSLSNQDLKIINPSINHQYSKLTLSENRILKNFSFDVVCWNSISHESLILYWVTGAKSCIKLIQPRQQQLPLH